MTMTNATKAVVITMLNNVLSLAIAFGLELSDLQTAAILGFGNSVLALVVLLTYKSSPKRLPEGVTKREAEVLANP